jgi:hypothetical protein
MDDLVQETLEKVERLRGLLLDPDPGRATWQIALQRAKLELDKLFEEITV